MKDGGWRMKVLREFCWAMRSHGYRVRCSTLGSDMKASGVQLETFGVEFLRRVLAASVRFFVIAHAWLFLVADATAAQPPTVTIDGPSQVTAFSATVTGTVAANAFDTMYRF